MTATTTTQAVEKARSGGEAMIEQYKGSFALVLPSHVRADQFVRLAQGVLRRTPALAKAANANPGSFLQALLDCARLGLEPGDTYHLVPFGDVVTGICDYKGEVELAFRAGAIESVKCETVHRGDEFEWEPSTMMKPLHRADWLAERGELLGVYAYADMKGGGTSRVVVMGGPEVKKHEAMSRGSGNASSPWQKWPESMWRKTAVHELRKWIPTSAEYRQQVLQSEAAVGGVASAMGIQAPAPDFSSPSMPDDDDILDAEIVPANADGEPADDTGGK